MRGRPRPPTAPNCSNGVATISYSDVAGQSLSSTDLSNATDAQAALTDLNAAIADVAGQDQALAIDARFGQIGHIILATGHAGAFQFLPSVVGKPGRDLEDHYAHIPTRKNNLGPKSDTPHAGIHRITT